MNKKRYKLRKRGKIIIFIFCSLFLIFILALPLMFYNFKIIGGDIVLNYGDKYSEPGFKATFFSKNVTKDIEIINTISDDLGEYYIKYEYNFLFYRFSDKRKVYVKDTEPPKIILEGEKVVSMVIGDKYKEPGYSVEDNFDKDLNEKVVVDGKVDTSKLGEYEIKYQVEDSSGNISSETRTVKVERRNPTTLSVEEYTLDGFYDEIKLTKPAKDRDKYYNSIVFVGDSNIKNAYLNGFMSVKQAWYLPCINPSTYFTEKLYVNGKMQLLLDAVEEYKPKIMILNLGIFGTNWIGLSTFKSKSNELIKKIKKISPETKIILSSLYPIVKGDNINNFSQDTINKYNFYILEIANKNNLKYLDVQTALKGSDGYANPKYYRTDKFHLIESGYRVFVEYVKTHALEEE